MSGAHIRANEVQKTTEPVRQPGRELIRQQEQGPVQAVARQAAYRRVQLNRDGLRPADLLALQRAVGNRQVQRMVAKANDEQQDETAEEASERTVQTKLSVGAPNDAYAQETDRVAGAVMTAPEATTSRSNRTGLPDGLKSGVESLSDISLDTVNVHYNSSQPVDLAALAYTQGSEIHVAPGQEQHLPHEAWHVVQQAQGRVQPTMQKQDGVPVNDNAGLEQEADVMGARAAAIGQPAAHSLPLQRQPEPAKDSSSGSGLSGQDGIGPRSVLAAETRADRLAPSPRVVAQRSTRVAAFDPTAQSPLAGAAQQRVPAVLQRRVALGNDISTDELKGLRVSDGGALGVVFIPDVVAKWEQNPDEAVATSASINAILSGTVDDRWKVGAPPARRATAGEAIKIAKTLKDRDQMKPGSVGNSARVTVMVKQFQTNLNNVVIYEQATGKDFVKYLAESAEGTAAAKKQSKGGLAKSGSGLAQLGDPGYARQLGRVAAIDIFMGHRDRLHGAGNFENWMSSVPDRSLTLVDNAISQEAMAQWSAHPDVQALAQGSDAALATKITTELEYVLTYPGYGGGKLGAKDRAVWNGMRPAFEAEMAKGIKAGRDLLWRQGRTLMQTLGQASPTFRLLRERIGYLHFGSWDDFVDGILDVALPR